MPSRRILCAQDLEKPPKFFEHNSYHKMKRLDRQFLDDSPRATRALSPLRGVVDLVD